MAQPDATAHTSLTAGGKQSDEEPLAVAARAPGGNNNAWKLQAYNSDVALGKALHFYDAQQAGRVITAGQRRVPWRFNAYLDDGFNSKGENMAGGWFDAGDHLKLMLPFCWTVCQLAWACLDARGQLAGGNYKVGRSRPLDNFTRALQQLDYGARYIMRCHSRADLFVAQIGHPDFDHPHIYRAEQDAKLELTARPIFIISSKHPSADMFGMAAAALAAASIVFNRTRLRRGLGRQCLAHARTLYNQAARERAWGLYTEQIRGRKGSGTHPYQTYNWQQYVLLAATWLQRATGERRFANEAMRWYYDQGDVLETAWPDFSWAAVHFGALCLLENQAPEPGQRAEIRQHLVRFCNDHLNINGRRNVRRTPDGLTVMNQWGSLRHACGIAAIMSYTALRLQDSNPQFARQIATFAERQVCYCLGASGHSFLTDFGRDPPVRPHHRNGAITLGQSGSVVAGKMFQPTKKGEAWPPEKGWKNVNNLVGALVGGPSDVDNKPGEFTWVDDRADYARNEVALDYNAAFILGTAFVKRVKGEVGI